LPKKERGDTEKERRALSSRRPGTSVEDRRTEKPEQSFRPHQGKVVTFDRRRKALVGKRGRTPVLRRVVCFCFIERAPREKGGNFRGGKVPSCLPKEGRFFPSLLMVGKRRWSLERGKSVRASEKKETCPRGTRSGREERR